MKHQRRPLRLALLLIGALLLPGIIMYVYAEEREKKSIGTSNGDVTHSASGERALGGAEAEVGTDADGEAEGEGTGHVEHTHSQHDGHGHEKHNHGSCGYNTAVKPWMEQTLRVFDTAREASRGMAKSRVSVASASIAGAQQEPAPIRIHTEFQLSSMQDYSKRYFLKYQLVPRMVAEIRRRMLVKKPVRGNLQVPRYCSLYYVREDGEYNCAEVADQEFCSAPEVGIKHNPEFLDGFTICSDSSKGSCRAHEGGAGAKDADFILYVAANDVGYCRQGHIVAFAGTCALDLDNNRPLAGFANFCPSNIDTSPRAFQDLLETAVHEALHALFFSELLFPYYLDENGEQRKEVVKQDSHGNTLVVTPSVTRAAREHFGCSDLEGAPLENEGGIGTAGNHWESRVFQGELMDGMSGAPNERAVFSAITMALIDDSGWYSAAWALQGNLGFGKDAGCSFLDAGCNHNKWFCSAGSREDSCSWDLKSVGRCSSELLLDGCSTPVAYRNMHCLQPSLFEERKTPDSWMWGFGYGADARCIKEVGPVAKVPGDGYRYTKFSNHTNLECYKFSCPGGSLHVLVDGHELRCPSGGEVDLTQIGYLSGRLGPCPDNARLCDQLSCPNLCSGNGDCHGGVCTCNLGYSGEDCAHATCLPNGCPQGLTCNVVSGLCEGEGTGKETGHCPSPSEQAQNSSNYGVIDYLLDMSAGGLSDCYISSLPSAEQPPSLVDDATRTPPPLQSGGSPASSNTTSAREAAISNLPSIDVDQIPEVQSVLTATPPPQDSSSKPPVERTLPAEHSGLRDPIVDTPRSENATKEGSNKDPRKREVEFPVDSDATGVGEGNGEGRVRITLKLRQLLGSAPLSQSQADQMLLILAASAGVSEGHVEYVALTPPASPIGVYIVVAEVTSSGPARVASSLRNAAAYGIFESRLREESNLECVSTEVKDMAEHGSGGLSDMIIAVLFGALGVAAVVIVVGAALLVCRCRRAVAEKEAAPRFTDIAKEPKTVEITSKGGNTDGSSCRRMLLSSDVGARGGSTATATITPSVAAGSPISARQQHGSPSSRDMNGDRPLRDRYSVGGGGKGSTPQQQGTTRSTVHQSRLHSSPQPDPLSRAVQGGRGRVPRG